MKRRDFLKYSAITSLPLILRSQGIMALGNNFAQAPLFSMRPDRKLILLQLNGGNDGLNTFIPLDQYSNLQKARPNIIIPENKLLNFNESLGLHPSFSKVRDLYQAENLLLMQSVGYPEPNLSHFRSKDIITSGSASNVILNNGWMGRMINEMHPEYPEGYPSPDFPHPLGLSIGSLASSTCQGYISNMSSVIKNLNTSYTAPGSQGEYPPTPFGDELKFIAGVMEQTELYLEAITEAADKADTKSELYPESGNSLSDQLRIVARLIAGGLQTQVYVVNLGGWDTHAGQTEDGMPEGGKHQELLTKLGDAMLAFQDDLKLLGVEDEVISLVYTEFGRRIKSNDSFGTDHGTAWPAILFGSMVNPVVLGSNPIIPDEVEKTDNLPMQFDFRSLYASIFKSWFEADDSSIEQVLQGSFDYLPILKSTTEVTMHKEERGLTIYPNPVTSTAQIEFSSSEGLSNLELFDTTGRRLQIMFERDLKAGTHHVQLNFTELSAGSYYLILKNKHRRESIPFIKR